MNKIKTIFKFVTKAMLLLFGVSLIFAVIISIYVKYYEAISLIIFLGVYGYLFLYGVIMVITPLIPPDEEDIIEYRKKDAMHRKYFLEDWLVAWCFLMVLIIGIGAYITVDSMKHKEIVEIEQSTYIKNVEKHEVRVTTWYDIYDVTYQYDGEECVDRVRYNDKFVPWTIKAEHSYVYVDEDGAQPFWSTFFYRLFIIGLAVFLAGFLITFFINIERTIKVAGELDKEEERLVEKKARKLNYILLFFTVISFLYLLIMLCIHFYPVLGLEF